MVLDQVSSWPISGQRRPGDLRQGLVRDEDDGLTAAQVRFEPFPDEPAKPKLRQRLPLLFGFPLLWPAFLLTDGLAPLGDGAIDRPRFSEMNPGDGAVLRVARLAQHKRLVEELLLIRSHSRHLPRTGDGVDAINNSDVLGEDFQQRLD